MSIFTGIISSQIAYKLFHTGLANIFCVQSLSHGTNPISNILIRVLGSNPAVGGSLSGSTHNNGVVDKSLKNYSFVFKDHAFPKRPEDLLKEPLANKDDPREIFFERVIGKLLTTPLTRHGLPKYHTYLSSYNQISTFLGDPRHEDSTSIKKMKFTLYNLYAIGSVMVSPTIYFHYSKIDPGQFEEDPCYVGLAYKTKEALPPWRIGILGSLLTGVNSDWVSRIKANPQRFRAGIGQITLSGCIIKYNLSHISSLLENLNSLC